MHLGLFAQLPELERVEPMSWWTGMKNNRLQLLVHGQGIAQKKLAISYPGVKLIKVNKVENPNYLFIDLEITASAKPGSFPIHFSSANGRKLTYNYVLEKRDQSPNRIQGISSKDLIYLVMPDRFSNGDTTNDVVNGMNEVTLHRDSLLYRHGGDLQGIINHLGYLKDLGVTAIWNTPEVENNQPVASYHGYAVTDHYKIDPRFGTNALYKSYVDQCHALGLKVIKDVVHNHIGSEHWLMKDLPSKDWVHQWPSFTQTNYKDQVVMDPYAASADKQLMTNGWFDRHMPDLNHSNPYVQNYLTQNHIWWIEYAGIDGLRLDTYQYNDLTYMSSWASKVLAEFPRLGIFGETLVNSVLSQAYFTGGKMVGQDLDTRLPGITDVQVKDAIYEALNGKFEWTSGINHLYSILAKDFAYRDASRNVIFLDNHDMSRFYSMVYEDMDKFKSGLSILLTMRGIPQLYYGTEILMKNYSNPDGLVRFDFKGGWMRDTVNKFLAAGRNDAENEAFNFVKKLANYRKQNSVLHTGKLMQYVPENGIYVYFRYNSQKTVMVIVNSNEQEASLSTARFMERIKDFKKGTNVITGMQYNSLNEFKLLPKTVSIIELAK
ncbi:MAG TPA: glycoside hydrolase family 13 protein [Chitinophagaceae bacterium]|nr:glycoside hydrolase family 13 protein [Chitinophagaceae bacterium]